MAKKVILAVAGAGKTYHICHGIDPNKRNLILAFTHENIHNIQRELCDAYGCVPELTTVSTFDAFVYHQLVLPYEPSISNHFGYPRFISRGISTMDPQSRTIKSTNGNVVANPKYAVKTRLEHYVTTSRQYYCANLSELVLQVKKGRDALVKRATERLNLFFDCVLIDEFQDFREYDYDLIMALAKQLKDIVLIGDYHQHSVSATNNSGRPFKKGTREVSYDEFVSELRKAGFDVDTSILDKSRRCSAEVCKYVSKKLGIDIASSENNIGDVIWVDESAETILEDQQVTKLVYKGAASYSFHASNWSYSKGDTMDSVCVILTGAFENLANDRFSVRGIPGPTVNKLYVAMTRSRGNLYLMKESTFKTLKTRYTRR